MLYTQKLKIVLQSNLLYIILFIFLGIWVGINYLLEAKESIYNENDNKFIMTITDYKFDGNKLSLDLNGREDLVASYYISNEEELNTLKEKIKYGVKIEVLGELKAPINNTIPYAFNYKKYLNNKGIFYTLTINELKVVEQENLFYKIKNMINKRIISIDQSGYMKAFILGDKDMILEDSYNNYQKIGITHLFALSGMHIGLFSGILLKLFKRINDKIKYTIVIVILFIYGFLVGFPSSILRCIIFFTINSINKLCNFKINSIKILLLTIWVIVLSNYRVVVEVGFLYSIASVGGLLISSSFINSSSKLLQAFKLSIIAFLVTLPISLYNFYEVNIFSIIYNLFYIPYVSMIVYPLSLISFIIPIFSKVFSITIIILEESSNLLNKITIGELYLSFNIIEIIIYYVILLLTIIKRKYILFSLLGVIILIDILIPYFDSNGYIYFLDIGQGDSSLIISPYKKDIIMIDTGGIVSFKKEEWMKSSKEYMVSDNVISLMKALGIKKIDLLILSHGDADHAKEVTNILDEININCLKINNGELSNYEKIATKLIKQCQYEPEQMKLTYLNYKDYNDENANSVLSYMKIYKTKIISFGDATKESEEDIIKKYNLKKTDIVKLSHHGSKTSSSYEYLKEIEPEIAIISSGRNNRFNHPSQETIETLVKLNINYLNTQEVGTIEFIINKNKYKKIIYEP